MKYIRRIKKLHQLLSLILSYRTELNTQGLKEGNGLPVFPTGREDDNYRSLPEKMLGSSQQSLNNQENMRY